MQHDLKVFPVTPLNIVHRIFIKTSMQVGVLILGLDRKYINQRKHAIFCLNCRHNTVVLIIDY